MREEEFKENKHNLIFYRPHHTKKKAGISIILHFFRKNGKKSKHFIR